MPVAIYWPSTSTEYYSTNMTDWSWAWRAVATPVLSSQSLSRIRLAGLNAWTLDSLPVSRVARAVLGLVPYPFVRPSHREHTLRPGMRRLARA